MNKLDVVYLLSCYIQYVQYTFINSYNYWGWGLAVSPLHLWETSEGPSSGHKVVVDDAVAAEDAALFQRLVLGSIAATFAPYHIASRRVAANRALHYANTYRPLCQLVLVLP